MKIKVIEKNNQTIMLPLSKAAQYFGMKEFLIDWKPTPKAPCPFFIKNTPIGYQLFAARTFQASELVLQYKGEIQDNEAKEDDYQIGGVNSKGQRFKISNKDRGGCSRFVAHAYSAPLSAQAATANLRILTGLGGVFPGLYALRQIDEGDALTFNYRRSYWKHRIERFPFGPNPLTKTGECLEPVVQTPSQQAFFFLLDTLQDSLLGHLRDTILLNSVSIAELCAQIFTDFKWYPGHYQQRPVFFVHSKTPDETLALNELVLLQEKLMIAEISTLRRYQENIMLIIPQLSLNPVQYEACLERMIIEHPEHPKLSSIGPEMRRPSFTLWQNYIRKPQAPVIERLLMTDPNQCRDVNLSLVDLDLSLLVDPQPIPYSQQPTLWQTYTNKSPAVTVDSLLNKHSMIVGA